MYLEPPIRIDERKLTQYLLIQLPSDDKSNYLHLAGYDQRNWEQLGHDLLVLAGSVEAVYESTSVFGDSYSITGYLTGPNRRLLAVKTIWMREIKTGCTKFITLYPPR